MSSQVESGIHHEDEAEALSPQADEAFVTEEGEEETLVQETAPVATHTEVGAADPARKSGMPQLDFDTFPSQIFWLVVTFAALYALLARSVIPRIHDVLENRQNKISHDLDRAEQLRNEAEEAREVYERALKESRAKAQSLITESAALMEKSAAARHAELGAKLSRQSAEAEQNIQEAKNQALDKLAPIARELTQQVVAKLTGHKPQDNEVAAVVDTLLKEPRHG